MCHVAAVNSLPENHHSADDIFYDPLEALGLFCSKSKGGGSGVMQHNITAHERTHFNRVYYFFFVSLMCPLLPEELPSILFIFPAGGTLSSRISKYHYGANHVLSGLLIDLV